MNGESTMEQMAEQMAGFELLRCDECGHEHVRPERKHRLTMVCAKCGGGKWKAFRLKLGVSRVVECLM